MGQKSLNCQKSAILNTKMSFWPLKTLFPSRNPFEDWHHWNRLEKNASFDILHIQQSENFYYCHSRMWCPKHCFAGILKKAFCPSPSSIIKCLEYYFAAIIYKYTVVHRTWSPPFPVIFRTNRVFSVPQLMFLLFPLALRIL